MHWFLLACASEPQPAPKPAESPSAMRDALRGIQAGETPDATPTDREPPVVPDEARREEPEPESTDPAECTAAKSRREALQQRILKARASTVDQDEDRMSALQAEMTACISDPSCASDGDRVAKLSSALTSTESSYDVAFQKVAELEAGLYAIDQDIAKACGRPRR